MLGVLIKILIGLLFEGNIGGVNVSLFKLMFILFENKVILEKIRNV